MKLSFQTIPDFDSPVIHSYPAGEIEGGLYCAIFFEKPPTLTDTFPMKCQGQSVYVISCPKGECFKAFNLAAHTAIVLSIPDYISLLTFFRDQWPEQEKSMNAQIEAMQKLNVPIQMDSGLEFYQHGSSQCSIVFDNNVRLLCRKESKDPSGRCYIHMFKDKQTVALSPKVLLQMSLQLPTISKMWECYRRHKNL